MPLKSNKKAITPIIAIVLIIMMTIAVGATMYYWLTKVQTSQQGTVGQSQERLFEVLTACASIQHFEYNTLTNISDVILQNCGNVQLKVGDEDIEDTVVAIPQGESGCSFILNNSDNICPQCPFTLDPGDVQVFTINFTAAQCSNTIKQDIKHDVKFYIDRKASTSRGFIPEATATCTTNTYGNGSSRDVCIAGVPPDETSCINLTIYNAANKADNFTFTTVDSAQTVCMTIIKTGSCGNSGTATNSTLVRGYETLTFYINHSSINFGSCSSVITMAPTECTGSGSLNVTTDIPVAGC